MGFETDRKRRYIDSGTVFEVSLWDLKQDFLRSLFSDIMNLKYPYGIWNFSFPVAWILLLHLKYPYGIWNLQLSAPAVPLCFYLKYPYGIWNRWTCRMARRNHQFEVSLWDLKLRLGKLSRFSLAFEVSLWDLKPVIKSSFLISLFIWSIPMGFETCYYALGWVCFLHLKYPYGIWN